MCLVGVCIAFESTLESPDKYWKKSVSISEHHDTRYHRSLLSSLTIKRKKDLQNTEYLTHLLSVIDGGRRRRLFQSSTRGFCFNERNFTLDANPRIINITKRQKVKTEWEEKERTRLFGLTISLLPSTRL